MQATRRNFLKAFGLGTAATVAGLSANSLLRQATAETPANRFAGKNGKRPNILFLFTDDQTFQSIGAWNNPEVKTPNIDKLFKRGTTFTHTFNQGSWSGAVCVCSRAMLNTGRYLFQCGGGNCSGQPLWGETFSKAGYETFMTGKWHNGGSALKKSFKHIGKVGGGMFGSRPPKGSGADPYNRPKEGNKWNPWNPAYTGHWRKVNGKVVHSSKQWADESIKFLNSKAGKSDNPFMMYVAFHAPHDPRQSPKEYVDMYPQDKIKIPENYLPEHPFDQGDHRIRDEKLAPFPRTKKAVQLHRQEYYAIITHADHEIGRILDALEKSGKADDTIIVFTGDHGLAVGRHGLMGKQNQYDHSVRMPFIFAGPGIEKGKKIDSLVYMQSLFATTCDMCGIEKPKSLQFESLVPLLTGQKKDLYDSIYGAYKNMQRMVRTKKYKLIRYPLAKEVQLFDIENDPNEIKDLAEDSKYASVVKDMDKMLAGWMKHTGDPLDINDPQSYGKKTKSKTKSKKKKKANPLDRAKTERFH